MTELLNCPFCRKTGAYAHHKKGYSLVSCSNPDCMTDGPIVERNPMLSMDALEAAAVEAWNRRSALADVGGTVTSITDRFGVTAEIKSKLGLVTVSDQHGNCYATGPTGLMHFMYRSDTGEQYVPAKPDGTGKQPRPAAEAGWTTTRPKLFIEGVSDQESPAAEVKVCGECGKRWSCCEHGDKSCKFHHPPRPAAHTAQVTGEVIARAIFEALGNPDRIAAKHRRTWQADSKGEAEGSGFGEKPLAEYLQRRLADQVSAKP